VVVMATTVCDGELLACARKKGGLIGTDTRGRAVRRPPMAIGVLAWAAGQLVTCGGPRPMAGRALGRRRLCGSRVAPTLGTQCPQCTASARGVFRCLGVRMCPYGDVTTLVFGERNPTPGTLVIVPGSVAITYITHYSGISFPYNENRVQNKIYYI
jgi:hypothetical protein